MWIVCSPKHVMTCYSYTFSHYHRLWSHSLPSNRLSPHFRSLWPFLSSSQLLSFGSAFHWSRSFQTHPRHHNSHFFAHVRFNDRGNHPMIFRVLIHAAHQYRLALCKSLFLKLPARILFRETSSARQIGKNLRLSLWRLVLRHFPAEFGANPESKKGWGERYGNLLGWKIERWHITSGELGAHYARSRSRKKKSSEERI